jgi:hypothetical protein
MQLTINLPYIFSNEKLSQIIAQLEQLFKKEGVSIEVKNSELKDDPWDNLNIIVFYPTNRYIYLKIFIIYATK